MNNIIEWLLQPSTVRGLIISVSTLIGFAMPEAKMEAILTIAALLLGLHELIRTQYDTNKLNKEG